MQILGNIIANRGASVKKLHYSDFVFKSDEGGNCNCRDKD